MPTINTGAFIDGRRAPSKRAIKIALAVHPERVLFDPTSPFNDPAPIRGDQIPAGVSLTVVGPDPFTKRSFYATVQLNARTGAPKLT